MSPTAAARTAISRPPAAVEDDARSVGRKMSWPADEAAANAPRTIPRWVRNQRSAMVAPRTFVTAPVPTPGDDPPEQVELPELGHQGERERGRRR